MCGRPQNYSIESTQFYRISDNITITATKFYVLLPTLVAKTNERREETHTEERVSSKRGHHKFKCSRIFETRFGEIKRRNCALNMQTKMMSLAPDG